MGLIIIAVTLIGRPSYAQSRDKNTWPNFRGINCSGIAAPEQDPPVNFGAIQNVIWKVSLPEGHSSPCIWGDNIFITGFKEERKQLLMFCLNRKDGAIKWEKNISVKEFEQANQLNNPATATPATDGESIYYYFSAYGILCYDYNGKLKWELTTSIPKSHHGMGTSPVVVGNLVLLNFLGHWDDPRVLAINKYNGDIVWKYSLPKKDDYYVDSYATPVIYKDQVIIYTSEDITSYNIKTGELVWRFITGVPDAASTPVLGKDILFTAGHSTFGNPDMIAQLPGFTEFTGKYDVNRDLKIDTVECKDFTFLMYPEKPEVSPKVSMSDAFWFWDKNSDSYIDSTEWRIMEDYLKSFSVKEGIKAIRLGGKGDISLTNFVWGNPEQASHVSSPLYYNNHVYMIRDGGIISCFDAQNGKVIYRGKTGATGAYFSSPVAAGGKIYIASRNGIVTVIDTGEKFNIIAQNNLGDNITATPAVVDNKLYLRTSKFLYAFGKK